MQLITVSRLCSPVYSKFEPDLEKYCKLSVMRTLPFTLALFVTCLLLTACSGLEATPTPVITRYYVTATPLPSTTPTPTSTATPEPTATSTSTWTPTPTPTAPPAVVSGLPGSGRIAEPVSQTGARCGLIDSLDFPMRPPDGEGTRGGDDFGIYRERYQGLHAGEDWSLARGRSMGEPIYSIGHGMVTYAQPNGWGRDGGVVIIEHVLPDWHHVLSVYGHLDPPSVTLRLGDCVQRGQEVGEIGDRQHLHFEIRIHMPKQPGPGYWSIDPTLAGWFPPSEFITDQRLGGSPGLVWMQNYEEQSRHPLGSLDDGRFMVLELRNLVGLSLEDGEVLFRLPLERNYTTGVLDADAEGGGMVYLADRQGLLDAYRIPQVGVESEFDESRDAVEPLWRESLPARGANHLLLQPGGGVVLSAEGGMWAVSESGHLLWELEGTPLVYDWIFVGDELVFSTDQDPPSIWRVDQGVQIVISDGIGGKLIKSGGQVYAYDLRGVYKLDMNAGGATPIYSLPRALPDLGDIRELDDGGLLLAHQDLWDTRLVLLDPDGTVRWEYSFRNQLPGSPSLLEADGTYYLVLLDARDRFNSRLTLLSIDLASGHLTRLFSGGVRGLLLRNSWAEGVRGDLILVNLEQRLLAIDPAGALEVVTP